MTPELRDAVGVSVREVLGRDVREHAHRTRVSLAIPRDLPLELDGAEQLLGFRDHARGQEHVAAEPHSAFGRLGVVGVDHGAHDGDALPGGGHLVAVPCGARDDRLPEGAVRHAVEEGARIHDREASPLFQDSTGQSEKKHLSSMLHNG